MAAAHAAYYFELTQQAEPFLLSSQQADWLDRLAADQDNLRAALDWAVESGHGDLAQQMVYDLWRFWQARGDLQEARRHIDEALNLSGGSPLTRALALEAKGGIAYWQGRQVDTIEAYEEALQLLRERGDDFDIARALYNISFPLMYSGDLERAEENQQESLSLAQAAGDRYGVGRAHFGLASTAYFREDLEGAVKKWQPALRTFLELDAPFDLGWTRFMLAQAHYELSHRAEARERITEGLHNFADVGDQTAIVLFLPLKAAILADEGQEGTAGQILGAAEMLKSRTGATLADSAQKRFEAVLTIRDNPSETVERAIRAGRRMTSDEAVSLAVSS